MVKIEKIHIYQIEGMEEYLPKQIYYGNVGKIQSFLSSLNNSLFPDADSNFFNEVQKRNMLMLYNIARNLTLNDMRKNLVIRKMNWYVEKIINIISENQCDYDGYCIFLEACVWFKDNKIEIEVMDCSDKIFERKNKFDYLGYINEHNYLKRDYSDKLLAYTCNLLELYGQYFEKEEDSIGFNIYMNGDKCFGGRGYIEWN